MLAVVAAEEQHAPYLCIHAHMGELVGVVAVQQTYAVMKMVVDDVADDVAVAAVRLVHVPNKIGHCAHYCPEVAVKAWKKEAWKQKRRKKK